MKTAKWQAVRVIKRMVDVVGEQLGELGYKDEALADAVKAVKVLARCLVDYLEKGA